MNVKELKDFLATLPEEAEGWDIQFGADDLDGIYGITKAKEAHWDEETLKDLREEGDDEATQDFVILWCGKNV